VKQFDVPSLVGDSNNLEIRFPEAESDLDQDAEWFEVRLGGEWKRYRIHDYDQVYMIPGLYECVVYRALKCNSPLRVTQLLAEALQDEEVSPKTLRVLDFGAGNGMEGPELQNLGIDHVVGADIIPEAKISTERDRPWAYADYVVADFTDLSAADEQRLRGHRLNAMTVVAALGFGDIPAKAFLTAIDLLETPAYLAFNIKEDFVQARDDSGFAELIRELAQRDVLHMQAYRRYQHRISCAGDPLYYIAMVATKEHPVPADMLGA
jgi:hypothetical protein